MVSGRKWWINESIEQHGGEGKGFDDHHHKEVLAFTVPTRRRFANALSVVRPLGTLPGISVVLNKSLISPGTGIGQGKSITVRGLNAVKGLQRIRGGLRACEFKETSWVAYAGLGISHYWSLLHVSELAQTGRG